LVVVAPKIEEVWNNSKTRGVVWGAMTTLGGVGHTPPFLIPNFRATFLLAFAVVLVELGVITWIRHRYMDTPVVSAGIQVFDQ